ncbi:unnamed protein product, partial [Mesorhabditis spiculigera]
MNAALVLLFFGLSEAITMECRNLATNVDKAKFQCLSRYFAYIFPLVKSLGDVDMQKRLFEASKEIVTPCSQHSTAQNESYVAFPSRSWQINRNDEFYNMTELLAEKSVDGPIYQYIVQNDTIQTLDDIRELVVCFLKRGLVEKPEVQPAVIFLFALDYDEIISQYNLTTVSAFWEDVMGEFVKNEVIVRVVIVQDSSLSKTVSELFSAIEKKYTGWFNFVFNV